MSLHLHGHEEPLAVIQTKLSTSQYFCNMSLILYPISAYLKKFKGSKIELKKLLSGRFTGLVLASFGVTFIRASLLRVIMN